MIHLQSGFTPHMRIAGNSTDGLVEMYTAAKAWELTAVEVGCCQGESAEIACNFVKHLYCVDPWGPGFQGNEPVFDKRMSVVPNYTKIKLPSVEAALQFQDESIDLVYIDGMHDYDNVTQDIIAWFPKVRMDGWISGHDYDSLNDHVGVIKAVDELLGPPTPEQRFRDASFLFRKTPALIQHFQVAVAARNATQVNEQVSNDTPPDDGVCG